MGLAKSKPKSGPSTTPGKVTSGRNGGGNAGRQRNGAPESAGNGGGELIVRQKNGGLSAANKSRKRTSFYETVDASEVLPYLIIG